MSPITKRKGSKRTEWKIRGSGQGAGRNAFTTVRVDEPRASVNWMGLCGDGTRTFTVHGLQEFVLMVDGPGTRYPKMWLSLEDANRRRFWVHLEDGNLSANDRPTAERGHVSWGALKEAFEEAIEALQHSEEEES